VKWPAIATTSGHAFAQSYAEIEDLLGWVVLLASRTDHVAARAHKVLVETAHSEEERQSLRETWAGRTPEVQVLATNRQILMETLLARHVDNLLAYFSSLLFEIFTRRPETLRSGDTVEVASVLRHSSIDALVHSLAERKVDKLTRESVEELWTFFESRLGLQLGSKDMRRIVGILVELRNMIVHHRCVVNQRFKERAGNLVNVAVGQKFELGIETYRSLTSVLIVAALNIDRNARKKFGLRGVRRGAKQRVARTVIGPEGQD
jgi:hypothetical protein